MINLVCTGSRVNQEQAVPHAFGPALVCAMISTKVHARACPAPCAKVFIVSTPVKHVRREDIYGDLVDTPETRIPCETILPASKISAQSMPFAGLRATRTIRRFVVYLKFSIKFQRKKNSFSRLMRRSGGD